MIIFFYILIVFSGFAIGRLGHIYGGHLRVPHHWIYGVVMTVGGGAVWRNTFGIFVVLFGIGLWISDFKDFQKLKVDLNPDPPENKRFWGID